MNNKTTKMNAIKVNKLNIMYAQITQFYSLVTCDTISIRGIDLVVHTVIRAECDIPPL